MVKFDPILAAKSAFHSDEVLPSETAPGPCAMGPTDGETIASMHVWLFQNVDGGVALATGDTRKDPEFDSPEGRRWRVPTALDPGSKEFKLGEPAVAVAIAIVGNGPDVRQWTQAVTVEAESPFPGRKPPPPS
jgi:hypothetical protein